MERNQAKQQNILIPAKEISNNIDVLTEILLRVPIKPVVRFKCISKQWLSLISNPEFCVSHTRHHHTPYPTPTALLLRNFFTPNHEFEIVPLKHNTKTKITFFHYLNNHPLPSLLRIRQSCNGLLLYSLPQLGKKYRPICSYYICNPIAKKFKSLSFPSLESVCMAFNPLKSKHYKLICIRKVEDEEKYQIDMYSSETDSWSPLGITFTPPNRMDFSSVVFCNCAVHWLSESETSLYFDVDRQCLNTMPMPNLVQGVVKYFGESRGHLHLIKTKWDHPLQFDVLEMAMDYSGWFVRYHVNLNAVRIALPEIIWYREGQYRFSVLHVIRAQKEEESVVVVLVDNKTISFNVHNGKSKKLSDLKYHVKDDYTWRDTYQYFEILTSV